MKTPSPEDILSLDADRIADFIKHHAGSRTLNRIVRGLNDSLLSHEPKERQTAARALEHLGFVEFA